MLAYYFPQIKLEDLSDEEFAMWTENAQWLHSQMIMMQQANVASTMSTALGGGG